MFAEGLVIGSADLKRAYRSKNRRVYENGESGTPARMGPAVRHAVRRRRPPDKPHRAAILTN